MSEELLKTIIQLFALVSKKQLADEIKPVIAEYLKSHVSTDQVDRYIQLFEQRLSDKDNSVQIEQLTNKVNQLLRSQQKMVLLIELISLTAADGYVSDDEQAEITRIAEFLHIEHEAISSMIRFVDGGDIEELSSENILIIHDGRQKKELKGPSFTKKQLNGIIAILKIPETDSYFLKYIGIDSLYLNTIPVKSRRVNIFPTGSTIRGNRISPIYYSRIVSKFLEKGDLPHLTFRAEGLYYYFKNGKAGLQGINISEEGGRLIGLMGASGAGKSTLLNVLNGNEYPQKGQVSINGINIHEHPKEVSGVVGFIPQDDLLIEELSVYDNLYYAAKLCFGSYSDEQLDQLVSKVLSSLGLMEIRSLRVGSVMDKTISGGQRKRVNIGLELLREPMVLFVDEPTSGLSSRDSENIMDLMKELSLRGKMIFVVIHQPSSDIFKMFDSLIILDVGGLPIYYGNPIEAVTYFQTVMDTANKNQGECSECGNVNPEQIFDIIETRTVNEYGRITEERRITPQEWNAHFKENFEVEHVKDSGDRLPRSHRIPGWFRQLGIFFKRDIFTKLANRQYMIINILEAPVLAAFIAYLVKYYAVLDVDSPEYSFYKNDNIPVFYFMSVVVMLFSGLTMSAEEIFRDRKILKREKYLNLSRSSYLSSKIGVMFLFSAFQSLTFFLVGNLILEIPLTEFRFWLILFSSSCFANMLGLNISSAFNSAVTIYILIPVLLIPQLLLSGVVVNFEKFNPKLGGLESVPLVGELMASRWAFEAFMVTQFRDNPIGQQVFDAEQEIANMQYKKIYFVPELETRLTYVYQHSEEWSDPEAKEMLKSLGTLRGELISELDRLSVKTYPFIDSLKIGAVDSTVLKSTNKVVNNLKGYYLKRLRKALSRKDSIMNALAGDKDQIAGFIEARNRFQNERVGDIVQNTSSLNRVVEVEGRLVRRIYPIYFDEHKPTGPLDFRGQFYIPTKHFLGYKIDTLYFNLAIIWVMTIILYLTLYFDLLRRLVRLG